MVTTVLSDETQGDPASLAEAALSYAGMGWKVIPLHNPIEGGGCTCPKGTECKSVGKHPRLAKWQKQDSHGEVVVAKWWEKWPGANVGVLLGEQSGLIDIECDSPEAERDFLLLFDGDPPVCPTFQSHRGKHRIFKWRSDLPGGACIHIGAVEVRTGNGSKGAQSAFPPSRSAEGVARVWLVPPEVVEPPEITDAIMVKMWNFQGEDTLSVGKVKTVPEGDRNNTLYKYACALWREQSTFGGKGTVLVRLRERNATMCETPLDDAELTTICENARKFIASAPTAEVVRFALTDSGNSLRFAQQHGDKCRYCHPWKKWLVWDGTRWKIDDTGEIGRFAKKTAKIIYEEVASIDEHDLRKATAKHALLAESAPRQAAMLELSRSELPILPGALDKDPWLLNCQNGTIDLRTGVLREHRQEDFITKICPVKYDPAAECKVFETFMSQTFGANPELVAFMQRYQGYCLTGDVSEQKIVIFYGMGANGKSTLLNVFMDLLGPDYGMKAAADLLMTKKFDSHPTERAALFGKRFVAAVETEEGGKLAETMVKELTGGDKIRARRMREDSWEFYPTHKLTICTNHPPEVEGTDHAIWRRLLLVPFGHTVAECNQDKHLLEKLRTELPGVLAWCVQGCLAWQREGLGIPPLIKEATQEYRTGEDRLGSFLDECCVMGERHFCMAGDLYQGYKAWCSRAGEKPVNQKGFGKQLTVRGFDRYHSGGTRYRGLAIALRDGVFGTVEPSEC